MNPIIRKTTAVLSSAAAAALLCTGALAAQSQTPGWCSLEHDHACHAYCTLEHDHALDAYCWLHHDCAQGCWNRYWSWYTAPGAADGSAVSVSATDPSAGTGTTGTAGGSWYCRRVSGECPNPDCPNPDCPSGVCPNGGGYYNNGYSGGHHGGGHHGRHH